MNTSIVSVVQDAVLELAHILAEPDGAEIHKAARMRTAADRVVTMCAGDAITAVTIAASLINLDQPVFRSL